MVVSNDIAEEIFNVIIFKKFLKVLPIILKNSEIILNNINEELTKKSLLEHMN